MNNVYFSASAAGFYSEHLITDGSYDDSLPSDVVELTVEETETYKGVNPPDGKMLGAIDGRPAWVDLPLLTDEQLTEIKAINVAQIQKTKTKLISEVSDKIETLKDRIEMGQDKAAELKLWKLYRIALDDIDVSTAPDIEWPVAPDAVSTEA